MKADFNLECVIKESEPETLKTGPAYYTIFVYKVIT